MKPGMGWLGALLLASLAMTGPARAAADPPAKSLYWSELAVRARLAADGRLHVSERQTIVFTGDWNGGERRFRLRVGQSLDFERIYRLDPATGAARPLVEGDLGQVDHYAFSSGSTLRWRSRLPTDPPFDGTPVTYLLEYTLSGVLRGTGDRFRLDHDFAFPERDGSIERFVLDLGLDPVWQPEGLLPAHLEQRDLAPGQSVVVTAELRYQGSGTPAAAVRGLPPGPVALLFAAVLAIAIGLGVAFLRREAALGRFGKPEVPERPDEEWLRQNVFDLTPEEVGTLWDGKVGPPEVAAVLARLVAEGKLASQVRTVRTLGLWEHSVLQLTRKADRAELYGYEKKLLDKLFFDRTDETDTDRVRKHYKSTGFDPAGLIAPGIKGRLQNYPGIGGRTLPPPRRATLALFAAGLVLLAAEALTHAGGWLLLFVALFGFAFLYLPGLFAAIAFRGRIERLALGAAGILLPMLGLVAVSALVAAGRLPFLLPGLLGALALAALDLAAIRSLFHNAQTRESAGRIQKRKLLAAARRHLARELRRPAPALSDAGFPYLLAFGLGGEVDRWFRAFGGGAALSGTGSAGSFGSTGSSGGTGGGSWTGGGGAFGGGGASASWAAAASGLASGVSAPSSGGSGGGGGGGGSSGGGGGGGW